MLVAQHVAVTSQRKVALETRKVTCVPVLVHCLRVLGRENQLITGGTSWSDELGVVPLAVDRSVLGAVAQVDQQLLTLGAREAGGMPQQTVTTDLRGRHGQVADLDLTVTILTSRGLFDTWNDISNIERLGVPRVTELLE